MKVMFVERLFRRPRIWSNEELKKVAHFFSGDIANVSGWRDYDKSIDSFLEYFGGDYNLGSKYQTYFKNASSYTVTNFPGDKKNIGVDGNEVFLDLEEKLPEEYNLKFDVVFNHTVLEHVFNVSKAFENLCKMSRDIVIIVVPFVQQVHDFQSGYKDYWRFTPFAIDRLFMENGLTVLYRSSNSLAQSSIYYFYVASKKPEIWKNRFKSQTLRDDLKNINLGKYVFFLSYLHLRFESIVRRVVKFFKRQVK